MAPKSNGGVSSRIGNKFFKAIEDIKDARLRNGKSRDRVSTEKITNLIIRHSHWSRIAKDIIEADQQEVDRYGL